MELTTSTGTDYFFCIYQPDLLELDIEVTRLLYLLDDAHEMSISFYANADKQADMHLGWT